MQTVYRGTQRAVIEGVRKGQSFAYSLGVAIIWSARPGDVWAGTHTRFLETSTVHVIQAAPRSMLPLAERNHCSLADVLRRLDYPNGISDEEVRKIYNYMHNRIIGKAAGGEFAYVLLDEDGDARDEDEVPLSFTNPQTMITLARDDWDFDPGLETADLLIADTYIFADAPAIQRAAAQLGHDALTYPDVFQGGEDAAQELLGCRVGQLDGVTFDTDLNGRTVPQHLTLRVLDPALVVNAAATPTAQVLHDRRFC